VIRTSVLLRGLCCLRAASTFVLLSGAMLFAADAQAQATVTAITGAVPTTNPAPPPHNPATAPLTWRAVTADDNTSGTSGTNGPSLNSEAPHIVRLSDGRLVASDLAPIIARGELVVAMLGVDSPPFFYQKDGKLVGIEVDLAEDLGRALGVKVRYDRSPMTFDAVVQTLAAGRADVAISKLSQTLARTREISYSQPYLTLNRALLLNRLRFAALARKRQITEVIRTFDGTLGVIASSSYEDYARRNFPHAQIVRYPSWDALIEAVKSGAVVAAYRDEFEIKRLLKSDPTVALTLRTVTFKDLTDTLAIGVRIDEPTLLSFTNEFLNERNSRLDVTKVLDALNQ
jgi:ABC-type amino acid transport substrate-binding protein